MPSSRSLFAVLVLILSWGAIYLPWLDKREIYGEEARRVLPGRTMLQNGDWMLPRSGGEIYNRKPPLVNWMSAAAITISGRMDEWTVRLPSTLMVLTMALCMYAFLRGWLGHELALLAALIALTSKAAIDKGRMIEIEALYVSLYGIAMSAWLGLRWKDKPLAAWIVSGLVLGLGFLAKGPPHLLYFYAIVIGVLSAEKKLSELWNWKHVAGLLCFFGVWVPWAIVNSARNVQHDSAKVWADQITHRIGFSEFDLTNYLLQIPMSLADFLPWVLLLPLLWRVDLGDDRQGRWMRGMRKGMTLAFFVIALLPSSRPRFLQPLQVVAAILVAATLGRMELARFARIAGRWRVGVIVVAVLSIAVFVLSPPIEKSLDLMPISSWLARIGSLLLLGAILLTVKKRPWSSPLVLGMNTAAAVASIMIALSFLFITRSPWENDLRDFAASIRAKTGPNEPILLFHVGEHLWPFYLGTACYETAQMRDRPKGIAFRWLVVASKMWSKPNGREEIEERFGKVVSESPLNDPDGREHYVLVNTAGR
jgi:4-amino-4-deoxy-L-arabinose transferase-like glycosyltransferase